jgi:hypothetical protein
LELTVSIPAYAAEIKGSVGLKTHRTSEELRYYSTLPPNEKFVVKVAIRLYK